MQHNMVYFSSLPHSVVTKQKIRSRPETMYQVPYARTDVYKYSFFPATVRMWNALLAP